MIRPLSAFYNEGELNLTKNFWKLIFGVYIIMVINFIVVKFNGNIHDTIQTIQLNAMRSEEGGSNYNLVPFQTLAIYLNDLSFGVAFVNIVGNIIPFIPMGFLIPMVFQSQRKMFRTMFTCLLIILSIESIQLFTYLGSFDVDDLILNMISCFFGFLLFKAYKGLLKKACP